ncbi:unnamed protein product, partial [Pylaiella littoralis]
MPLLANPSTAESATWRDLGSHHKEDFIGRTRGHSPPTRFRPWTYGMLWESEMIRLEVCRMLHFRQSEEDLFSQRRRLAVTTLIAWTPTKT